MAKNRDGILGNLGDGSSMQESNASNKVDKSKTKNKLITFPEYWEETYQQQRSEDPSYPTWLQYIRSAIREKMEKDGIEL